MAPGNEWPVRHVRSLPEGKTSMPPQDSNTPDRKTSGPDDQTVLNTTEARQGSTRFPVRYVLMASMVLAVVAMVVVFLVV